MKQGTPWTPARRAISSATRILRPADECPPDQAGRFGGREGCVVAPVVERYDPALGGSGRVILKSISADYLARKGGTDDLLRESRRRPVAASVVTTGVSPFEEHS
jgi:hypothetical protein